MSDARAQLEKDFGGPLPPGLAALSEDQHEVLATALSQAQERQAAALSQATEHGLDFIPKLLRGPVKKVLFR